jgi:hypothetical protein
MCFGLVVIYQIYQEEERERSIFMDDAIFNLMLFELSMFDGNTRRDHEVELIEIV